MENEFVPYKEALALKELGFNELCLARFDGGGFRMLPVYDPLKNDEIKEHWFCVTPLYQQAFQWFREKHNLHHEVQPVFDDNMFIRYYRVKINDATQFSLGRLLSHEEAELKSLGELIRIAFINQKQT